MIDPVSAASLAVELAAVCVRVFKVIKKTIEARKKIKGHLLELLNRVERMRNILELLRCLLREISKTEHRDLAINLNEEGCRRTMKELQVLADKLARTNLTSQFLAGIQWQKNETEAKELVIKLQNQEQEIVNILVMIGIASSLKSERDIQELRVVIEERSKVTDPFDEVTLVDDTLKPQAKEPAQVEPLRTWLGHVVKETHDEDYVFERNSLSEAAYWGDWRAFWEKLNVGSEVYSESWINATRLKPLESVKEVSHWTPMHQAVYNHVDDNETVSLLQRLIQAGASRTLRTQWTGEFAYLDMTPLELAQELGYESLFDILSPVIHQTIPAETVHGLQRRFHDLIISDLGDRVQREHIRLPILEVLTELEDPFMWFPLQEHTYSPAGYAYRLDGRELLVKSYNIQAPDSTQLYRITAAETLSIEQALSFG